VADTGPSPRDACGATYVASRQRVVLFGGETIIQGMDGSTWTWDGKHWTERQDIGPGSRVGVAMTFDSQRKRAVLFGGGQGEVLRQDTWELFELA